MNLVTLALASDEERRRRDLLTFASWGSPLTLEQYLEREVRLRAHRWPAGAMRTWLLRDERGEILSSCETFRMGSSVRAGGERLKGTAYGVASVFTEERRRRRGYARELLRHVHRQVRAEDATAQAFILYSEVSASIYERAGYAACREWNEDWIFPPSSATGAGAASPVPEAELERALALASADPLDHRLVIWPSVEQLDWHRERERLHAQALGRPRALACGAEHPEGVAIWAGNLRSSRLDLLLLRARTLEAADALIESARRAARAADLGSVCLWKCPMPEGWTPDRAGGRAAPREACLPMILTLHPGIGAEEWRFVARAVWV